MQAEPKIRFEEESGRGRYTIAMPDGQLSQLTFMRVGANHVIADHTYVPPAWRNQGVAERLVERLIADARESGTKITPTCWFVADEFARHRPDWDDLLKE